MIARCIRSAPLGFPVFALAMTACGGSTDDSSPDEPPVAERRLAYESPQDVQASNGSGSGSTGGGSSGGGGSASPPSLSVTFEDCTKDSRRNEMRDALDDILDNWGVFKAHLEDLGLTSEHECMHDRLIDNGNVRCDTCDLAGHSSPLGQTANICRSWASSVEDRYPTSSNSRKVCWASVIMHEFGHTCERFEGGAEVIDNAARQTLNDLYGLSLDADSDCNQD